MFLDDVILSEAKDLCSLPAASMVTASTQVLRLAKSASFRMTSLVDAHSIWTLLPPGWSCQPVRKPGPPISIAKLESEGYESAGRIHNTTRCDGRCGNAGCASAW